VDADGGLGEGNTIEVKLHPVLDRSPRMRQNVYMRVISLKSLRVFWEQHPNAERPLRQWYKTAIHAGWNSLAEARKYYPHADCIRTQTGEALTIFNIGGNKFRLIARIRYDYQLINIRAILTHRAYDEGQWKE
jgi:mRNA interferase HigB